MEPQAIQPHHTTFIIATITVIIIFLGGIFLYFSFNSSKGMPPAPAPTPPVAPTNTHSFPSSENPKQLLPKAVTNPVGDLPKANPFSAKTNPFQDTYKNPFE